MDTYTVKQLAEFAGVSVRTLHYYDEVGLLKPEYRARNGYRYYSEAAVVRLQQIMFFRELGFGLDEIKEIMSRPNFNVMEALEGHRDLLKKQSERLSELLRTIDSTLKTLKGEKEMTIKEYYQGFSDEQIEQYRNEVRERWGEDTLKDGEARVMKMGKAKFAALQAEGGAIFKSIADNINKGFDSPFVQNQVALWRQWLENFSHYSDEAVLGLGQAYSQDKRFAAFFRKINKGLPEFLSKAIAYRFEKK
jgi:MerR family transcriptional regulator, thiopeptide resistance regulator